MLDRTKNEDYTHTNTYSLDSTDTHMEESCKKASNTSTKVYAPKRKGISYMGKFSSDPFLGKSEKKKGKSNKGLKMAKKGRQKRKKEEMRSERRK